MDYQEALDFILKFADYERVPRAGVVFDLRRMELLLNRLGNPHNATKSVHIAGTKGKGSTSAMIASILTRSGYRTGLYTSPHLLSFTERIQLDGKNVPEEEVARLTAALKPEVEEINRVHEFGELTTFEILTALAFAYYRDARADYQVLEVGLGGRLDATNVIARPEVCVITNISFDHMDVLGHTLKQIATEKAGIIKPGSVVVSAPQLPEAMEAIQDICRERRARLIRCGSDVTWRKKSFSPEGQSFELAGLNGKYDLSIPLAGEYQIENAACAVAAAEVLAIKGAAITPQKIAEGLARVHWQGRLQALRRKPWLIIDGAHNAWSAKKLVQALPQYFPFKKAILIMGSSSDKDISGMVAELATLTNRVITTRSRHPRSVPPDRLVAEFARFDIAARASDNVKDAVEMALAEAKRDDLICATGSIFVIAEVMEHPGVSA